MKKLILFYGSDGELFAIIVYSVSCYERRNTFLSDCNCNEIKAAALVDETNNCPAIGYQRADVCVQVTVAPFAETGETITKCCGDPVVTSGDVPCAGRKNGVCTFSISQTICVEVPVAFGAKATVGDTYVDCLGASSHDICTDCEAE